MTLNLRCLAVRQPYAWAICAGAKMIENRSWTTKHRGQIVIVASSTAAEIKAIQKSAKPNSLSAKHLVTSAAIGVVDVVDVFPLSPDLEGNPWAYGPYCWTLANGRLFKNPISCKGKLNLYSPDDELSRHIEDQLRSAAPVLLDVNAQAWIGAMQQVSDDERRAAHIENYDKLGDWPNLLRLSSEALSLDPDEANFHFKQGIALFEMERFEEAAAAFGNVVRLAPEEPLGYHFRGLSYVNLGEVEKAEQDFAKVEEIDPEFGVGDDEDVDAGDEEQAK